MNNELFDEYKSQYKLMHEAGNFAGGSFKEKYIGDLKVLVNMTKSKTILDFGCGKASAYKNDPPINKKFGIASENMSFYDIGVPEYEDLPEGIFDGVICTDVLEHVHEELLDDTIETIMSKSEKFVFLVISCGLAVKTLPNGENAHVTVKHPDWWNSKLKKYYDSKKIIHVKFVIPPDPKQNILKL